MEDNLQCSVCLDRYRYDNKPRNLTCGHVLCTQCPAQVLVKNPACPECRANLNLARVQDYVVAFALLNLAQGDRPHHTSRPGRDGNPRQNAGECPRHGSPMFFRCLTCSTWVCRDCVVVDHREPPHGSCNLLDFLEALESMKSTGILDTKKKLQSVEKISEVLKETLNCANSNVSKYENELENILNKIEAEKYKVRRLNETLRCTTQVEEGLQEATHHLAETSTNEGLSRALQEVEDHMAGFEDIQDINLLDIESPEKQTLGALLDDGVDLYMTQTLPQQRFGRITKHENKLLLSALRNGSPPSNGISLQFESVRCLVPRESPWVYLEVGWQEQHRGTVYIQMYGDTPRARQMALLCSAETGPSYIGTSFYKHEKPFLLPERIYGGDYEHNNGKGGPAVVEGITDGGEYLRPIKAGHVIGIGIGFMSMNAQYLGNFGIILKDNPNRNNRTTYGEVKSGLDILLEASQLSQIKEVTVTNCGLVIPLDESDTDSLDESDTDSLDESDSDLESQYESKSGPGDSEI